MRKERDLNPRYPLGVCVLSRDVLSATQPSFQLTLLTLRTAYGVNRRAAGNAEEAQRSFSSQKSETSELLQLLMSNQSSLRVCSAFSAALRLTPYSLRKVSE